MLRIIKNEFIKFINGYMLGILISMILMMDLIYIFTGLKEINSIEGISATYVMIKILSQYILYVLPIFIIVFTSYIIAYDYQKGTAKFSLISDISRFEYSLGKFVFILLVILISLVLSFATSFMIIKILGVESFNLVEVLKAYMYCIPSLLGISFLAALISIILNDFQNSMICGIFIYFAMIMIDVSSKAGGYFTLSSSIILGYSSISDSNLYMLTSVIYIIITFIMNTILVNRKDITL